MARKTEEVGKFTLSPPGCESTPSIRGDRPPSPPESGFYFSAYAAPFTVLLSIKQRPPSQQDRGRKLAVPPLVRRLLTENGLAESPAGPLRCIGRARRSLLRRAQGAVGFGPLLGDVFTPSFSPPSTHRRLSVQNGRALLFPVIALTGGSITGNGGFVKWAVGFSQGNTASPVPVRTDLNIRSCTNRRRHVS